MPTYQYQCTECQQGLEVVQKFSDDALTQCPSCEGRLKKVFSSVGIVFKGSGFYRTDSRNSSTGSAPSSGGEKKEKKETAASSGSSGSSGSPGSASSSASGTKTASAPAA
ncbi:FmdB family zinc ribbon protein [Streptomyces sp. YIM 98790]|uniref:FmdB family zinc ribbon protein n=1 Tax=Streptomyces sp. YIM 98790 TaxID=2689077 RepID=UPI00140C03C2|nr:FmdB family zinc ribbon protein [Streptomyces sp. YIM 98790]